jgi:hypothetical protein
VNGERSTSAAGGRSTARPANHTGPEGLAEVRDPVGIDVVMVRKPRERYQASLAKPRSDGLPGLPPYPR